MGYRTIKSSGGLRVRTGNTKLGKVHNVSLLPIVTCNRAAGCARDGDCYALKLCHPQFRKSVHDAWSCNTAIASDPAAFFAELQEVFDRDTPERFRFFTSGDVREWEFMLDLFEFCSANPDTEFLLFTKRYVWAAQAISHLGLPGNLKLVLSAWPGLRMYNPHGLPVAWMRDSKNPDPRIPNDATECSGTCETCDTCWSRDLSDVVFDKH